MVAGQGARFIDEIEKSRALKQPGRVLRALKSLALMVGFRLRDGPDLVESAELPNRWLRRTRRRVAQRWHGPWIWDHPLKVRAENDLGLLAAPQG